MDELLASELSAETLAALQAHLLERHQEEDAPCRRISASRSCTVERLYRLIYLLYLLTVILVHWYCSWYDEKTGRALAQEAIDHSSSELRIAFVSTPAAYRDFLKIQSEEPDEAKRAAMGENVYIFEYDRRFGEKYGDRFCFYDYNAPTELPDKFHHFFDYVLMEPPHLSPDCLEKFSDTMRWLARNVEQVPGKKDRVVNPSTFINCTCALPTYLSGYSNYLIINSASLFVVAAQLLRKEMKADLGFTPRASTELRVQAVQPPPHIHQLRVRALRPVPGARRRVEVEECSHVCLSYPSLTNTNLCSTPNDWLIPYHTHFVICSTCAHHGRPPLQRALGRHVGGAAGASPDAAGAGGSVRRLPSFAVVRYTRSTSILPYYC